MRVVVVFAAVWGCGAEPRPQLAKRPENPPTPSAASPQASVRPRLQASPQTELQLEALVAPTTPVPLPKLEILEPAFGETLDSQAYRRVPVRMRTENTQLTRDAEGVLVSLDGRRGRRLLPGAAFYLGDLLPEDEELQVGPHTLFAVGVGPDGRVLRDAAPDGRRALSMVDFFVGARKGELDAKSPRLLCVSPVGTHYLARDARLVLEVLAVGFSPESAEVHAASREPLRVARFDPRRPQSISGLPFGDVELTVTAAPAPPSRCIVTLNPGPPEGSAE